LYGSWPITRTFPRGRSLFFRAPRMGARRTQRHGGPCHARATMDHATPSNPRDSCRVAIRIAGSRAQIGATCHTSALCRTATRFRSGAHAIAGINGAHAMIHARPISPGAACGVHASHPYSHTYRVCRRSRHRAYAPWRSTAPSRTPTFGPIATRQPLLRHMPRFEPWWPSRTVCGPFRIAPNIALKPTGRNRGDFRTWWHIRRSAVRQTLCHPRQAAYRYRWAHAINVAANRKVQESNA